MKIALFANTDWYLYNFRSSLAQSLVDRGHSVLLVSPAGPYGAKLKALGFRWVPAPMLRESLNPLRELYFMNWLRKLLIKEQVDLIHGFTIKSAAYASLIGRLLFPFMDKPARVSSIAGMGYVFTNKSFKAWLLRPLVRCFLKLALRGKASHLILQNIDDYRLCSDLGLADKSRLHLIPGSGVDCNRFSPVTFHCQPDRCFRVVLPARLLWDKGIAEFVDAARILIAEGKNIEFLLAGLPDKGNPAAIPEETLHQWVEKGLVKWLGHVDDMAALYHSVDVVVLPSYREGLPKSLIEAAACALPLITTNVPGCRDVVTEGVDGLLVPVKNSVAISEAIKRIQENPILGQKLGQAAREKALTQFDEKIVIERTIGVYGKLHQIL